MRERVNEQLEFKDNIMKQLKEANIYNYMILVHFKQRYLDIAHICILGDDSMLTCFQVALLML